MVENLDGGQKWLEYPATCCRGLGVYLAEIRNDCHLRFLALIGVMVTEIEVRERERERNVVGE